MPPKDKYTDPKLRDEVKEEIHNSDKGGAPGQWSARKAQMMAQEYKRRGGGYTTDKKDKDESQKHLDQWTDEDWQTKDGSAHAKKEDGTQQRYLPKKAWDKMSDKEKEETEKKKEEGGKKGKQYVSNTDAAKEKRKEAQEHDDEGEEDEQEEEEEEEEEDKKDNKKNGTKKQANGKKSQANGSDANGVKSNGTKSTGTKNAKKEEEDKEDNEEGDENDDDEDEKEDDKQAQTGQKRKSARQASNSTPKKQKDSTGSGKTVGSKHMPADEPAPRGSADRLPKKGQKIVWKAMPGYVDGEVLEVLTKGKTVDGKSVKAAEDDPKIVLKSEKSGKICVHKPDACFYD